MRRLLLCLALTSSLASPALAWNHFGHMVIAAAAYEQLTPAARDRANRLLKLNPDYPQWVAGHTSGDVDELAFAHAATWPDDIKSEARYRRDGEQPSGPDSARNIGYADQLQHRYWHFVDLPFSPDHTPLIQPEAPNAVTQIVAFRAALASPRTSDDVKSYDLVWLLHLVGDVHQPLHAAARFTHEQPQGDEGGNRVSLCDKPRCRAKLHGFWDDVLGTSRKPELAVAHARKLAHADSRRVAVEDPSAWARESLGIAETEVYVAPIGAGPGPYRLTSEYRAEARKVARQQAALAGARLAQLLNAALGKASASSPRI